MNAVRMVPPIVCCDDSALCRPRFSAVFPQLADFDEYRKY